MSNSNRIFIAAQSDISLRMKRRLPLMHVFGGICEDMDEGPSIRYGLDFGGGKKRDFSTKGSLSKARARQAILMPVSVDTAKVFKAYVTGFKRLKRAGFLPFYFSGDRKVIEYKEVEKQWPIDLYGKRMPEDEIGDFENYQRMIGKKGAVRTRNAKKGLVRSRAACAVFFNFAGELSGIDLPSLHPEWSSIKDGDDFSARLNDVFEDATQLAHLTEGVYLRSLGDRGLVLKVSSDNEMPMNEIVAMISEYMGGFSRLEEYFNARKPLETPALAMPSYIRDALNLLPPEKT